VYFVAVLSDQPFSLTHPQHVPEISQEVLRSEHSFRRTVGPNTTTTLGGGDDVLHKPTNWFLCDGSEGEEKVAGHLLVAFLLPVPEVFLHVDLI
jgi:hypothetical protein